VERAEEYEGTPEFGRERVEKVRNSTQRENFGT
jgi:hypothetical protein